jgi:hypothetical protein
MAEVDPNSDRAIQDEITIALRAKGHEFRHFSDISHDHAIFRDAAALFLDAYPALTDRGRFTVLVLMQQGGFPSPALREQLYDLLIDEGTDAGDVTRDWSAGDALVRLAGRDRDRMLEFAADARLGACRKPIILALAKRRDLRVVPLLEHALRDLDMRATGIEAIGLMRLHAFAPAVHDSLHDGDLTVRDSARKALERLQDGKT